MPRKTFLSASLSCWLLAPLALLSVCTPGVRADDPPALWIYTPTNLGVPENVEKLHSLWKRAADAGYDHILLADSKFAHLDTQPRGYFDNVKKAKAIAAELKMQIVPSVFPIGYSNDLLFNDPNLAEGLPVRDTPFVVTGDTAHLAVEPIALAKPGFHDDNVTIDGRTATFAGAGDRHRFTFELQVTPYRCYHVSVLMKTQDFKGSPLINPLGENGEPLSYTKTNVEATQDWKQYDIVFDSLTNKKVNLYFGLWEPMKGTLLWKDWKVEETGLVNLLRREGTPCVVRSDDGKTTYTEGKDYDPIIDSQSGRIPWGGEFRPYHEPTVVHTHGLPDGTKLRISWYFPPIIYDGQVSACISDPKTTALLADQAKRMKELWGTAGYMMEYDEFRCCNQDESCKARHMTPGQMLADSVKKSIELLRPQTAYTWNDMFDPYHNAVKGPYYLVDGPWTGSWEGLDKSVVIMNWNYGKRDDSLKFFEARGNPQILCGFYDGDMSDWQNWLNSAAHVKNVVGYMYTTWTGDFSKLESFAQMSRKK